MRRQDVQLWLDVVRTVLVTASLVLPYHLGYSGLTAVTCYSVAMTIVYVITFLVCRSLASSLRPAPEPARCSPSMNKEARAAPAYELARNHFPIRNRCATGSACARRNRPRTGRASGTQDSRTRVRELIPGRFPATGSALGTRPRAARKPCRVFDAGAAGRLDVNRGGRGTRDRPRLAWSRESRNPSYCCHDGRGARILQGSGRPLALRSIAESGAWPVRSGQATFMSALAAKRDDAIGLTPWLYAMLFTGFPIASGISTLIGRSDENRSLSIAARLLFTGVCCTVLFLTALSGAAAVLPRSLLVPAHHGVGGLAVPPLPGHARGSRAL